MSKRDNKGSKKKRHKASKDIQGESTLVQLPKADPSKWDNMPLAHEVSDALSADDGDPVGIDKAKIYWLLGVWDELASLDLNAIQHHPERYKYALMVAAANQQLGYHDEAKRCVQIAIDWGCSRRLVSQILMSGLYNTLGRASAINGDLQEAHKHFETAIALGAPSVSTTLVSQTRSSHQLEQISRIKNEIRYKFSSANQNDINSDTQITYLKKKKVIVIAGMRHAGSTALFNIVRLSLAETGVEFISCYSEYENCIASIVEEDVFGLIKTHEKRQDILKVSDVIITARRDLRDSTASAVRRKFPMIKKIGNVVEYANYNKKIHEDWRKHSNYEFVYETYMKEPCRIIQELLAVIGINGVDAMSIKGKVDSLSTDNYAITLLSPAHITDPEQKLSFLHTLSDDDVNQITVKHQDWLIRYGYLPVDSASIYI